MYKLYKNIIKLTVVLFVMFGNSCTNNTKGDHIELESIFIDFTQIKDVELYKNDYIKITELETTDSSLIREVDEINFLNDKMLLLTRNKVMAFDYSGNFLFNVGHAGEGPEEYLEMSSFFVKNGLILLVDHRSRKVLSFNEYGKFVESISIPDGEDNAPSVATIYPINDTLFIGKNRYRGPVVTPTFSILDENYVVVKTVEGHNLESGLLTTKSFNLFKDEVLYGELMNDTIFCISNPHEMVRSKYYVDFNKYAIPIKVRHGRDTYDLIEWVNKPENRSNIATLVRYIHEDDQYVRFVFAFREIPYYVKYNKSTGVVNTYRLIDSTEQVKINLFMDFRDGQLTLVATDLNNLENNPILIKIGEKELDVSGF